MPDPDRRGCTVCEPAFKRYTSELARLTAKVFQFRAVLPADEWAESIRRMDGGRRFKFDFAPYQREMIQTCYRKDVQMVCFMMASRLGKTECVMNVIGHSIDEAPRRILVLYPTTSQAEKWSKETLEKELFESTPALQWLVRGGRRNSSNTILHKLFPGGLINIFGGNAPGEMRRAKGNLLFCDECDALEASGARDEGDQLSIFWTRGTEYSDTIRIAASYPSVEGQSRIAQLMETSDYRKWFTPCAKCSKHVVLSRDHLHYPEGKPEEAWLECPECGEHLNDDDRKEMMHAGEWRPTREFKGTVGFFGSGMMSPHPVQKGYLSHLHFVATQEEAVEQADNPDRARHVLVNTFDALPYRPERIEAPETTELMDRLEDYQPRIKLPDGVLLLTCGVDVQKRYLELSVWGWGENKESWLIEHETINGAPDDPGTWSALESFLASCRYPHPTGHTLGLLEPGSRVMVDAGHWDQHVLPFTFSKQALGVAAVQGSPTINAPVLGKVRLAASPKARIYPVGVNQCKDIIYSRLSLAPPPPGKPFPPGYIHMNKTATRMYLDGLTCEYGKEETFRGEMFTRYVCPAGKRNEVLDCACYAMAARVAINPRFDRIRENMAGGGQKKQPRPRKRRPQFVGGFQR